MLKCDSPARTRIPAANLRTWLETIIDRAGLKGWPKLWQNLQATCETEWAARFPSHVCDSWIGHSARVAQQHYLQVTDEDFAAALNPVSTVEEMKRLCANRVQQPLARRSTGRTVDHYPIETPCEMRGSAIECDGIQVNRVGVAELEKTNFSPGNIALHVGGGAESGALLDCLAKDPDFAIMAAAWSQLSPATKEVLLQVVRLATGANP
jgi:hypothetical protein